LQQKLDELQARLHQISEEIGDLSITLLREAVESGATQRPPLDKTLSRARRSVDKAAALLDSER